jgi:hypothetical protein
VIVLRRSASALALVALLCRVAVAAEAEAEAPAPAETPPPGPGPVERLSGPAFPEWTPRGLAGGSLALSGSMHGMPWPYTPRTGLGISGYVWSDGGYEIIKRGNQTEADIKYLVNQVRGVARLTPTYSAGEHYVQGQAELVLNGDQSQPQPVSVTTDDLWLRAGKWKAWDLQVGRYEAFEVYHFGMGMDLNTLERQGPVDTVRAVPDVPGLTTFTYRQNGVANAALHGYFWESRVRVELLGQYGFDAAASLDGYGVRPAAVVDLGWLKLKGAGYWKKQFPVRSTSKEARYQSGFTGAAQLVFAPWVEGGVSFAQEITDHYLAQNVNDPNASMGDYDGLGSLTTVAVGGFLNARVVPALPNFLVGGGLNHVRETDQVGGEFTNLQGFVAAQVRVGGQLYVKVVGGWARASLHPGGKELWENAMLSGRVRLMYLF